MRLVFHSLVIYYTSCLGPVKIICELDYPRSSGLFHLKYGFHILTISIAIVTNEEMEYHIYIIQSRQVMIVFNAFLLQMSSLVLVPH